MRYFIEAITATVLVVVWASTAAAEIRDPGSVFRDCGACPRMVVIPAGSFTMGRKSQWGVRHGRVKSFAIGKYEITFAEWDACLAAGGCNAYRPDDRGWGRGRRPVINVSWKEAKAYVDWLSRRTGKNYRLPSEAEWEYAARSGTTTRFWWGNTVGQNNVHCGACGSRQSLLKTAPVGSFRPNPFGLHDMLGNVGEMMADCWHDTNAGAPSDGRVWTSSACKLPVQKGAAYNSREMGAGYRYPGSTGRMSSVGFRVVRTLK